MYVIVDRLELLSKIRKMELLYFTIIFVLGDLVSALTANRKISLPSFKDLCENYPGYRHHNGHYNRHELLHLIGHVDSPELLHDTSALRLSHALNQIGGNHSLGTELIRLSTFGRDSITGKRGLQYIYHPIAYGPYLADKYGYPNVSKMHQLDPNQAKAQFWKKQGMLRVITYTKIGNQPVGHVALWDCTDFYQSKDWMSGHKLLTVEFWESPDSDCTKSEKLLSTPNQQEENNLFDFLNGIERKA
ncbi:hypothetical protein CHS0354_020854 [Potamilus streckersoni]|uniref:Uncharacterized protein n=1 Tax=Potamilus streckersoni TaxID=2493646 RepID=A0AAE0T6L6_9BIVA|nr:hypothetical protein CHS0354_020854 [Potamilus streckersoni]